MTALSNQKIQFSYWMYVPIVGHFVEKPLVKKIDRLIKNILDKTGDQHDTVELRQLKVDCIQAGGMRALFTWGIATVLEKKPPYSLIPFSLLVYNAYRVFLDIKIKYENCSIIEDWAHPEIVGQLNYL